MLITIRTYRNLKNKGMARAWEISGMSEIGDKLVGAVCWLVAIAGVLFLLSDYANASASDEKAKQAAYVAGLEKIVAACLSDSTGKPVMIGDEWFLCGIVPIGRIK